MEDESKRIPLPEPDREGGITLNQTLSRRRSTRDFAPEPLSIEQLSQILWSAGGINESTFSFRTIPSAGGFYPLTFFIACGQKGVEGVEAGVYRYDIANHALTFVKQGDVRLDITKAALIQHFIYLAPVVIVICVEYEATQKKYGARGARYVLMQVGLASQDIYLQAASLDLGTVFVGAFDDDRIAQILDAETKYHPMGIMPLGKPG